MAKLAYDYYSLGEAVRNNLNTTDSSARKWAHASHGGLSVTNYVATWTATASSASGGKTFLLLKDLPRCIILPDSTFAWGCGAAGVTVDIGWNEFTDYSGKDAVTVAADADGIADGVIMTSATGVEKLGLGDGVGLIPHQGLHIPSPADIIVTTPSAVWLSLAGFTLHLKVLEL